MRIRGKHQIVTFFVLLPMAAFLALSPLITGALDPVRYVLALMVCSIIARLATW